MEIRHLVLASVCGFVVHRGIFIHAEWHMQAPQVVLGHVAAYGITAICLGLIEGKGVRQAGFESTALLFCYALSLCLSILIYRHFFHRLHGFPGPTFAKSSKLWHVWGFRHLKNHVLLQELHEKYGNLVRTGPMEVTIFDAQAFEDVYGLRSKCMKGVWYDFMQPNYSVISARRKEDHDKRRRLWGPAFTAGALEQYKSRIMSQVWEFGNHIEEAVQLGKPLEMNSLCYWFAFDAMGNFAFGSSFGMLESTKDRIVVRRLRRAFELLGIVSPVCWLAQIAFKLFPRLWRVADWNDMMGYCFKRMNDRLSADEETIDVTSFLVGERAKDEVDAEEMKWLRGDAVTMIVAGSDSTAPALTMILYFLAKYPEHAEKIHTEIVNIDIEDSLQLQDLDHLNAVINETMRLFPIIPTGGERQTPPEGLKLEGGFIPGNVNIVMPRYVISRREEYFQEADCFIPERWYSRPELVKHQKAHLPFNMGTQACLGKDLALMDVRLVIASVVQKFTMEFDPSYDPECTVRDAKDEFTFCPGELRLVFKSRARA